MTCRGTFDIFAASALWSLLLSAVCSCSGATRFPLAGVQIQSASIETCNPKSAQSIGAPILTGSAEAPNQVVDAVESLLAAEGAWRSLGDAKLSMAWGYCVKIMTLEGQEHRVLMDYEGEYFCVDAWVMDDTVGVGRALVEASNWAPLSD
jgi:hypothetical protein